MTDTTARAAGADAVGIEPVVIVDPPLTPALRAQLVDMWVRVTNAGGAVGFVPPVVAADVQPTAERSFARVAAREDTLVCLAVPEPDGSENGAELNGAGGAAPIGTPGVLSEEDVASYRIIGWLLLAESESHLRRHWRTVYRVQVDPDWQGGGLGRRLMADAANVARDQLGLEALTLMTRGGTGAEDFYLRCGYREVGRIPGAIRVHPGDDRDEVHFWLDLVPDADTP
jgi:GNAT superfamily N-acetyltransferase